MRVIEIRYPRIADGDLRVDHRSDDELRLIRGRRDRIGRPVAPPGIVTKQIEQHVPKRPPRATSNWERGVAELGHARQPRSLIHIPTVRGA